LGDLRIVGVFLYYIFIIYAKTGGGVRQLNLAWWKVGRGLFARLRKLRAIFSIQGMF
jgi:hypothetical protein